MGRMNGEKQTAGMTAVNEHKIVDIRYRRLLRDVMAIPLEEACVDVGSTAQQEEDEAISLFADIFAGDR